MSTDRPAADSTTQASLDARVRELFLAPEPPSADEIRALLAQLHANVHHASVAMHSAALYLLGSWAIFVFLGTGSVERVEVLGLSLKAIDILIVLGPPLVAAFGYLLLLSYATSNYLIAVVSTFYEYHLPTLHEQDLDKFLAPPTFSTMENLLVGAASSHWLNILSRIWVSILTALVPVASLGAVLHTSYLLFLNRGELAVNLISVGLAGIIWLRGTAALATAYQAATR